MAIRLIDRYPSRVDPATSNYPHGQGRNKSDPTADDGTPFDEDRFNDQEAFFQGLLTYAGITPSGVVDTVQQSDYLNAFVAVALSGQSATDGGTDAYQVDFGADIATGQVRRVDFGAANDTTTPTLENTGGTPAALTITTKDGSALWDGALSGVHTLQLASGGGSWLVLDPNPLDGDQPASVTYVDSLAGASPALALEDAIWSWWTKPLAVRHNDKLFFTFVTQEGSIGVAQFDYSTQELDSRVLSDEFTPDDHNAGSITVDDSGIAVFFPGRRHKSDDLQIYYYEADTPDIHELGVQQTVASSAPSGDGGTNYPNTYEYDGRMFLTYRGERDPAAWYSRTNDWPLSAWDSERKWFESARSWAYFATRRSRQNQARVLFCLGWHPEEESHADLYFGYFDGESTDPWDVVSNGSTVGNLSTGTGLPLDESAFEKIYNADEAGGEKTRLFDVHDDTVVFASYTGDASDGMYHVARKSGGTWSVADVVATGSAFNNSTRQYFGGMAIDDQDPDTIYLSRESGSEWIVEEYHTDDDGSTWNLVKTIERSTQIHARPIAEVKGLGSSDDTKIKRLFWSGRYNLHGGTEQYYATIRSNDNGVNPVYRRGEYMAVGQTITFTDEGDHIDIPVDIPQDACQFRVEVHAVGGPAPSTEFINLKPNGQDYTGEFAHESITGRGSTLSSAESTGANNFNLSGSSGEYAAITMSLFHSAAGGGKRVIAHVGGQWDDGSMMARTYFGTWDTSTPWNTIGRLEWPGGSSVFWQVSVTRIL